MSILPSFTDIGYFLEVAEVGNISRAAERLGITQPSLSSAIKRLEDSLDSTLFVRGRTGVQLTKAGSEFLGRGRQLMQSWEQLRADVNKRETGVSGQYIIGCHPSVALYTLPYFLPKLVQSYPALEIKLSHDLSRKITESVVSFAIDFGIVVNPVRHPDLVIQELCTDDVSFWVSKKPSKAQSLDTQTGVLICDPNLLQVQKLLSDLQKKKMGFKRIIHSGNLEVIAEMTSSGAGIGILPSRVAARSQNLKLLSSSLPSFRDKICLVYRPDLQRGTGARVVIEAIKTALK